ncbi:hypothetical protein GALL_177790 [mine drainage metagenome]|uniref:Uncharacterized protein n=1 Tax=mine drainage metagenome TaxID=410659 RepID=A0A1J5S7C3_9ZZZZ
MNIEAAINKTKEVIIYQQKLVDLFGNTKQKNALYWFCKAYLIVTKQQLEYISSNRFQYPLFVANVVVQFNAVFQENLEAYLNEAAIPSEEWEAVFYNLALSKGEKTKYGFIRSWKILVSCVDVHIKKDLPLCLASVINEYYAGKKDIEMIEKDFLAMTNIFHHTAKEIEAEIVLEYKLPVTQVPLSIRNFFLKKYIQHKVIRSRENSWRAAQLHFNH